MAEAPFGLAVAAGMVAAVNPCGFALLPAYLSFLIVDDTTGRRSAVGRALAASTAMTAGFATVFGVFGLAVAPVAGQIQKHLPWITIGIGMTLVGLGGWLLAGRELPGLPRAMATGPRLRRTALSMVTFGAAYAIASLSCTIGPFMAVVVTSFRAGSSIEGVTLFLAYAVGMGLTVTAAALAVALARAGLVTRLRATAPLISRLGGLLLLVAGAYVAYYGWWENRVLAGDASHDPVIDTIARGQRWLATTVEQAGAPVLAAAVLVLLAAGLAIAWPARHNRSPMDK
jgi:cytochrome c biogenesis protein CcdA